ncbi:MAG: helix-turn-helix domain-containing protein [Acidimicrobiales bacterium]
MLQGGDLISRARRRARLSQSELGRRMGTTGSAVSRWENRRVDPSFCAVARAAESCGAELSGLLAEREVDPHDLSLLESTLAMSASQRLKRLIDFVAFVRAAGRR